MSQEPEDDWQVVLSRVVCGRNRSEHTLNFGKHNVTARYMRVVLRGCAEAPNFRTSLYWLEIRGR